MFLGYFLCCCQDDGDVRWISTETKQIIRSIRPPSESNSSSSLPSPGQTTLVPYDSFLESLQRSCFCVKWIDSATLIHDDSLLPRSSHFFSHSSADPDQKGPPEPQTFSLFSTVDGSSTISLSVEGNIHLATVPLSKYRPSFAPTYSLFVPISLEFTPDLSAMYLLHSAGSSLCLTVFDTRAIALNQPHLQLLHHHVSRAVWLEQRFAVSLRLFLTRWTDEGGQWMEPLNSLLDCVRCLLSHSTSSSYLLLCSAYSR